MSGERISVAQAHRLARMNIIAGFLVWGVALAGVSMMMPVMYKSILESMHWTIGETTRFMAIKSAASALGGLVAGPLLVRLGAKKVLVPSIFVIGIATSLLYFAQTLPFYYALAAVSGVCSVWSVIAIQVTLARWYSASLGRMTGLAMLGGALAGFVVPMGTRMGVNHFGWHATAGAAGLIVLVLVGLSISLLVHETPEAYGYTADELDPGKARPAGVKPDLGEDFASFRKTPQFWMLILATALSGVISNGINEYIPLFIEKHTTLGATMAALGFTIVIVISGLGKIIFGWVFDRLSTRGVALCWALCGVAALATFPLAGYATFLVFTILRGVSHGGVIVQAPVLARHIYGVRALPQVISLLTAAFHLGAAAGIVAIGIGVDKTGGFTLPFIVVAGVAFVAAAIGWQFHPRHWAGQQAANNA